MKIVQSFSRNTSVVLTTLNGHIDQNGNIQTVSKSDEWSLVSDKGGVDHFIKTNRFNNVRAKHKFVNNTNVDLRLKWSINIITKNGQNMKYDFGDIMIKSGATCFSISVPYKFSSMIAEAQVKRIMVALMII